MLFKNITILDENFEIKQNMYVGILGDRIDIISDKLPQRDYGRVYDGKGKLLMPGFFNAHAHSPMTIMRGYGENLSLHDWLNKRIFPFEDHLDSNAVYWGQMLAMAECLRFGIVSNSDMYFFTDDMVAATADAGLKGNICRSLSYFDTADPRQTDKFKEAVRGYEQHHNTHNGRIKIDLSIHSEYTSNDLLVDALTEYALSQNARMHIHISETKSEVEGCRERHGGLTPVQYFEKHHSFDGPALAAHCVWLDEADYDILKAHNVSVASNPVSNLKLASGVANVPEMLRKGLNVCVATDSVCSNNSLNMFEEMKVFAMASKMMYGDPTAVTPREALMGATVNGAKAQGRDDCGLVKEGFKADLIVLDVDRPNMYPVHDMLNNLVYSQSGSDVELTMIDGEVLYENGEYTSIDLEKTVYEATRATEKILRAL